MTLLPPSSAARRMACPGSRALEAQCPDPETDNRNEGKLAHKTAAWYLKTGGPDISESHFEISQSSSEMISGAKLYAVYIDETWMKSKLSFPRTRINIEEKIEINIFIPTTGTPDSWFINDTGLHIFEYKYGRTFIDAFENWQMIAYAFGIFDKLSFTRPFNPLLNVNFHVIQPRNYHKDGPIRKWEIPADKLAFYFDRIIKSEHLSMQPDAPLYTGEHCINCRARGSCPTLKGSADASAAIATIGGIKDPTPSQVGEELQMLQRARGILDARIMGLEEIATRTLKQGHQVPGFVLERSNGRAVWTATPGDLKALGELFGIELFKAAEPITPHQARAAGIPEKLIDQYSERTPGALKLVPENLNNIRRIFDK